MNPDESELPDSDDWGIGQLVDQQVLALRVEGSSPSAPAAGSLCLNGPGSLFYDNPTGLWDARPRRGNARRNAPPPNGWNPYTGVDRRSLLPSPDVHVKEGGAPSWCPACSSGPCIRKAVRTHFGVSFNGRTAGFGSANGSSILSAPARLFQGRPMVGQQAVNLPSWGFESLPWSHGVGAWHARCQLQGDRGTF